MKTSAVLNILPLLAMVSAECSSGEFASGTGDCDDDTVMDIYTILAIVFLSCLGLLLLVRMILYFVSFGLEREAVTSSTAPVIRIEGTGTCNVPKDP